MMTDQDIMQVDVPAPTSEQDKSGTQLPDLVAQKLSDAFQKAEGLEKANRNLTAQKAALEASNESRKRTISSLEVNNDFARFRAERTHEFYANSVKGRYLSPETEVFTMAYEQIQELLNLLGEERTLTNSLQERLDHEIVISSALEIGAQGLHDKHNTALEAVDELRSQKEELLARITHLENVCGERYERIALVERELQKVKSVTPESRGSMDMEIGGVSLTTENESSRLSSPGQATPRGHAVCLIDGNHLPFTNDVIYILGGDTTAKRIIEGVRSMLKDDAMDLRVAIYVDTDRITQACLHDFQSFVDSFNSVSPWVEIIDTRSSRRIIQVLQLHLEDPKCEFIMFGGEISGQLMSLAQQYKDVQRRFYAFSKPEELRQPEYKDYIDTNPLGSLFRQHSPAPLTHSDVERKPPAARSHVEHRPSSSSHSQIPSSGHSQIPSSGHSQVVHEPVTFDQLGRRVDPRLYTTQPLINFVTSWRLCNNHYLIGKCVYKGCHHNHNRQLSKDQLGALTFLGRSLVCRNGPACDDPTCYAGHTCPRQTCDGQQCGFPQDQHLEGTIRTPETRNPFKTSTRAKTSFTSTSFSNPTGGRTILPARINTKEDSPGNCCSALVTHKG